MSSDENYINRCLELARLGAGNDAPNPMVGAVLVYNNRIIGEGFHKKFGEAHAEVNCINSVSEQDNPLIKQSTLYVSLEPCSHYGKTPPCADLIIKNEIPKVVIGCVDAYKEVAGRGIKKLEAAGINVSVGILERECIELNKRFFTFHKKRHPYIILKWAQSVDGKIASAFNPDLIQQKRYLISNEYSNRLVHKWRSEEASILVGTDTARLDDPSLTTRLWRGKSPVRLIIDNDLKLNSALKIFNKEVKTIIFNLKKNEEDGNLIFYKLSTDNYLQGLMKSLFELNIQSVIIEGGTKLLQSFINEDLWDEARIITNRRLAVGEGLSAPELKNFIFEKQEEVFTDMIVYYRKQVIVL